MDVKSAVLSHQLRHDASVFLDRRRRILVLSLVSMGSMGLLSLYQMGIIKHLPDPPLPHMNAEKVDASAQAYAYFATPDAVLGLASYAATTVLAAMGAKDRAERHPWLPLALATKTLLDTLAAGKLTVDQWTKHRAFCFWCLLAAGATSATFPLSLAEARAAIRHLKRQRQVPLLQRVLGT